MSPYTGSAAQVVAAELHFPFSASANKLNEYSNKFRGDDVKVAFSFPARVLNLESGLEAESPVASDVLAVNEEGLADYFDSDIADVGIVGGLIRIVISKIQQTVEVSFWCPEAPTAEIIRSLQEFTVAQLDDGIGEYGFELNSGGKRLLVIAETDKSCEIDVKDDGRIVSRRPEIAIAARDGNLSRLATLLAFDQTGINRLHQGCSALHLAILYGHGDAVPMLLAAGADPDQLDSEGQTPLEACALSYELSDVQSRDIALQLLDAGSDPQHQAPNGESARTYAELRGKFLLAAILAAPAP